MKRWMQSCLLIVVICGLCLLLPGMTGAQDAEHTINAAGVLYAIPDGDSFRGGLLYRDGMAYSFEQGQVGALLAVRQFSASLKWNGQTLPISFDWCQTGDESISLCSQPEPENLRCAIECIAGNTDTVLFQLFEPDARLDAARYGLCHLTDNTAEWLFTEALEPYEILSLELSPALKRCVFSTLSGVYYYDGQQAIDLTGFCTGSVPTGIRWQGADILLFSAAGDNSARIFCQRYAPGSSDVTDIYENEPRYVQQRQPEGLQILRTCGVNVYGNTLRVISLSDGTECRFDFPTEGLYSICEPAEGLLTAIYETGSIALLRSDGTGLHQVDTGIAPTLRADCSVHGDLLSVLLENEVGEWVYQLPLDTLF